MPVHLLSAHFSLDSPLGRCLEDIRALFPPEWQPFYAGFGNRDTDEISYLAVGIPAAKILIINNRSAHDTYDSPSLALVHRRRPSLY
jgi:hypothetical protein